MKLPASWPNSSASIRFSGSAAQFITTSGPAHATGQVVKALGDQFLAGAALADHQDRTIERRGAARALDRVEEGQALPDELICPLHVTDSWCRTPSFGKMFRSKNRAEFGGFLGLSAISEKVA